MQRPKLLMQSESSGAFTAQTLCTECILPFNDSLRNPLTTLALKKTLHKHKNHKPFYLKKKTTTIKVVQEINTKRRGKICTFLVYSIRTPMFIQGRLERMETNLMPF